MNIKYAIEVNNLTKIYASRKKPDVVAVDNISFAVEPECIFGLLGPNGAGKSTTIKILTTLLQPTSGHASVNGYDCVNHPLDVRKSLAVVLQQNSLELFLTVLGNLHTYARFQQLPEEIAQKRITEVLDQFGLYDVRHNHAIDLSGGMRRRLQVAKAFLCNKPVIFLDEATTGLDPINKRATLDAIREQRMKGTTIVLTTHVLDEAEELCDRIVIIDKGQILADGSVSSIKRLGKPAYNVLLILENINEETSSFIKRLSPIHFKQVNNTINMTLQENHGSVLDILQEINTKATIKHFEIHSADLEDVFIELLNQKREKQP